MKRLWLLAGVFLALVACQRQHPVSVYVDESFQKTTAKGQSAYRYEKVAVFPFLSALHSSDDPDGDAPRTMTKFFQPELNTRTDYKFIAPNTVLYSVDVKQWNDRYEEFTEAYATNTSNADMAFLEDLSNHLKCDAFLIPVVDTWQKDEVDVLENATPATYVGATITIVSGGENAGKVLFRATDEDYIEGARTETGDRTLVTGASGAIRSDPASRLYAAPPFEDIVPKVIEALVGSLPRR